jgi:hypothetical protein
MRESSRTGFAGDSQLSHGYNSNRLGSRSSCILGPSSASSKVSGARLDENIPRQGDSSNSPDPSLSPNIVHADDSFFELRLIYSTARVNFVGMSQLLSSAGSLPHTCRSSTPLT